MAAYEEKKIIPVPKEKLLPASLHWKGKSYRWESWKIQTKNKRQREEVAREGGRERKSVSKKTHELEYLLCFNLLAALHTERKVPGYRQNRQQPSSAWAAPTEQGWFAVAQMADIY